MSRQIITGHYNNNGTITLYTRNENYERDFVVVKDFRPYFYVPIDAQVDMTPRVECLGDTPLTSLKGDKLKILYTKTPSDVPQVRDRFKHYEADIPFVRRLLIDTGIFSGISNSKKSLSYKELEPCDFTLPPRILYCDTETLDINPKHSNAFITIATFYDSLSQKYFTVAIREKPGVEDDIVYVKDEKELLETIIKFFLYIQPDIFTGWNISFDKDYIDVRCERYRLKFPWEITNVFDLLKAYKTQTRKSFNRLQDVHEDEKLQNYYEPFKEEFHKDLPKALKVNHSHVDVLLKIDAKYQLINFYWDLKNFGGFESMDSTLYHGAIIENLLLRRFHGKYVLNSKPSGEETDIRRDKYEDMLVGGKVFTPPVGIFDNVGVYDMTRYYPEMLVSRNLSPEPHEGIGLVPSLTLELIDKRIEYDRMLKKFTPGTDDYNNAYKRRQVLKDTIQSIVGYFGAPHSRVFDPDIFNAVTTMGQRGLEFISEICKKDGYTFLMGDTDSCAIQIPFEKSKEYEEYLNKCLEDFVKQEKIDRKLSLKLDRYYTRIIFKRKKGTEEGVKKRYAAHVCLANLKRNVVWTTIGKNKSVNDIKIGDKLIAFDNGKFVQTNVTEIFRRKTTEYLRIVLENNKGKTGSRPAGGENNSIVVTPEHPFFVKEKWIEAKDLKIGDELLFITRNDKNRILEKYDEIYKNKLNETRRKNGNTEKSRNRASLFLTKKWKNERELCLKNALKALDKAHSEENIKKSKETRERNGSNKLLSELRKKEWKDKDSIYNKPEIRKKMVMNRIKRPTYVENIFIDLFDKHNLPIDYVGDGSFWIGGFDNKSPGRKGHYKINPDFLVRNEKKVIEVYGSDLRKGQEEEYEKERIEHCKQYGYKCICFCVNPNKYNKEEILSKINKFVHNGIKIVSIKKSRIKNVDAINFHCEPYNNYFVNGVLTHNCWEGKPVNYTYIRGFEYVRRDSSAVTKTIQKKLFDLMLKGEKQTIISFIKSEIDKIYNHEYTLDDIAIPVTISKNPKAYGKPGKDGLIGGIPDYVKGCLYSMQYFDVDIRAGDLVKFIYVKKVEDYPPTETVALFTFRQLPAKIIPDLEKMVERNIRGKIEDLIELIDLTWNDIYPTHKSLFKV